jgi:hypothetical protein
MYSEMYWQVEFVNAHHFASKDSQVDFDVNNLKVSEWVLDDTRNVRMYADGLLCCVVLCYASYI